MEAGPSLGQGSMATAAPVPAHALQGCGVGGGTKGEAPVGEERRDSTPAPQAAFWVVEGPTCWQAEVLVFSQRGPQDLRAKGPISLSYVWQKPGIRATSLLKTTEQASSGGHSRVPAGSLIQAETRPTDMAPPLSVLLARSLPGSSWTQVTQESPSPGIQHLPPRHASGPPHPPSALHRMPSACAKGLPLLPRLYH